MPLRSRPALLALTGTLALGALCGPLAAPGTAAGLPAAGLPASGTLTPRTSPGTTTPVTGSVRAFHLTTAYDPALRQAEVVRWNPCQPIGYRINTALAGPGATADVQEALRRLSAASGLSFRYLGRTSFVPSPGRDQSRVAPLVIAWARTPGRPGASGYLTGGETGHGGWSARWTSGHPMRIVSGQVVLQAGGAVRPGFGAGATRGRLLLHELGHAVGLQHVADARMEMSPQMSATSGPAAYQAGDLTGLRRVGRAAGCLR